MSILLKDVINIELYKHMSLYTSKGRLNEHFDY